MFLLVLEEIHLQIISNESNIIIFLSKLQKIYFNFH